MKYLLIILALTITASVNAQSKKSSRSQKKSEVRKKGQLTSKHLDWHTVQDLKWVETEMAKANAKRPDLKLIPIHRLYCGLEYNHSAANLSSNRCIIAKRGNELYPYLNGISKKVAREKY